jgi:hypothetical protein
MSSLTYRYILSFSVKYFFQLIYTDYTNQAYLYNRSHLIFSETAEPNKTTFCCEWRSGLSDTILKGGHIKTIQAKFGSAVSEKII